MFRVMLSHCPRLPVTLPKASFDYSTREWGTLQIWPSFLLSYLGHFASHHYLPLLVALFANGVDGGLVFPGPGLAASHTPTLVNAGPVEPLDL